MSGWWSRGGLATVLAILSGLILGPAGEAEAFEWNQDTTCVLLNQCNADPLSVPADCTLPENMPWCNCVRSILTNPTKGQATGMEQGIIWIMDSPAGIGNQRVDVRGGTLDVSGIQVGDVIGGCLVDELIPEGAGVPPGTKLYVRGAVRVTGKDGSRLDFDVVIVNVNTPTLLILRYDPKDAAHSNGILYRGRVTAGDSGKGFLLELRYEGKPGKYPALEPKDVAGPGFNVRFAMSYFTPGTAAAAAYTLPADGLEVEAETTIRKFTESNNMVANPDEILPLGETDLCKVIPGGETEPCRTFDDFILLSAPGGNRRPIADICVSDPLTMGPLDVVFIQCGEGRAILRGSNSTDGESGSQGLTYLWEVVSGPEGGAVIPEESKNFKDAEISFLLPGKYTIRLTVNDGQATNNIDTQEVVITAELGFVTDNLPPEITEFVVTPDPPVLDLVGASVTVHFRSDANTGADGCTQALSYLWEEASGADGVTFSNPQNDETDAIFTKAGEYLIRLTVDDGAPENSKTTTDTDVVVKARFQRCNANGDANKDLSDAVFSLNYQFLGGDPSPCLEAMDCNGDGDLDIADPVYYLNFLFLGGLSPPPPYPNCEVTTKNCDASLPCPQGG